MKERVAVIGVGYAGFDSITPGGSLREMMFEAAVRAYEDAQIGPRRDVQSFVSCAEDFWEGVSITDEYMPDQLGAALRPLCTVASDGILGVANAYMQVRAGAADVAVVEAHSKASDVLSKKDVFALSLDPVYTRPLKPDHLALANLEMNRYLHESGNTREHCAMIAVKNKGHALLNPLAVYGAPLEPDELLRREEAADSLTELEVASHIDGSIVLVLASEQKAKGLGHEPIWVEGVGWCSVTSSFESRDLGRAAYAEEASKTAYRMAGVKEPRRQLDFAEVDDAYSYKELQHLEALGICGRGEAGKITAEGVTGRDGEFPVNPSGGALGVGHLLEATGLCRVLECVLQLRGHAMKRQIPDAQRALALSWRGHPSASGAVVILGR